MVDADYKVIGDQPNRMDWTTLSIFIPIGPTRRFVSFRTIDLTRRLVSFRSIGPTGHLVSFKTIGHTGRFVSFRTIGLMRRFLSKSECIGIKSSASE